MSSLMTSSAASLAAEIWKSFGAELVIFVVTLAFAFLIRTASGYRVDGKQSKTLARSRKRVEGNASQKSVDTFDRYDKQPAPAGGANATEVRSAHVGTGPRLPNGERGRRYAGDQSPGAIGGRHAWTVVDEIIDGMREQQNMKFAGRVLTLYDEFRALLSKTGNDSRDAFRRSKYSPPEFYSTVVNCAIRASRPHLAPNIIDDMIELNVNRSLTFYECAMKQLAGQKQYHLALAVYDRLAADGLQPSAVTSSCLVQFAAEVGEFQRAIEFFKRLSEITTPSIRAYMTILRVHGKRQDWPASLATLRDMQRQGVSLDALALNVALATGLAADRLEEVAALVTEFDGYKPPISDVVSYNTLIKGYAQHSNCEGAAKAIANMKKRGLRPNAITFNTAMDATVRAGQVDNAWKLLGDMKASGLRPDKFTCSILVKGLSTACGPEQVQGALDMLADVDGACDAPLKSTLYHSVLEVAAKIGGSAGSELTTRTFSQMREKSVTPTAAAQRLVVQALPSSR